MSENVDEVVPKPLGLRSYGRNRSGSIISQGQGVYCTGAEPDPDVEGGTILTIAGAGIADTSLVIGVAQEGIDPGARGQVAMDGGSEEGGAVHHPLDEASGWTVGQLVYMGAGGTPTPNQPIGNHAVLGFVISTGPTVDDGTFLVKIERNVRI